MSIIQKKCTKYRNVFYGIKFLKIMKGYIMNTKWSPRNLQSHILTMYLKSIL